MRIACPHCGERDRHEFTVLGDATSVRPEGMNVDPDDMFAYVYVRENVAGAHHEFWYHGAGCHAWLVVERDTRTHEVLKVETARDAALARSREGR